MPYYEYVNENEPNCDYCREPFTLLVRLSDPVVSHCPYCKGTVRKIISPPNIVAGQAHKLKESTIEKAGFTQYKKAGDGVYEKTAGKGPGVISAD